MARTRLALSILVLVVFASLAVAHSALAASRPATEAESKEMWRTVDPSDRCERHPLGRVSSIQRSGWTFGRVTISDRICGDSRTVLRTRGTAWSEVSSGSDWGADLSDTCSTFVPKLIPLGAVRELVGRNACWFADSKRCGDGSSPNPLGGAGLIIQALRVKGLTCKAGFAAAGPAFVDEDPKWDCDSSRPSAFCLTTSAPKQALRFRFGGDMG